MIGVGVVNMGNLKYVYVVRKVLNGGRSHGEPCSVFTSKEKALRECERLSAFALHDEANFEKGVFKRVKRYARLCFMPSKKGEDPGFWLMMMSPQVIGKGDRIRGYFVNKRQLDARSPAWAGK